jgi:hypothetical protein
MPDRADYRFILEKMRRGGYSLPDYVTDGDKTAGVSYDAEEIRLDGKANVWLSAVKLASLPDDNLTRKFLSPKVASAAKRYGILPEVEQVFHSVPELLRERPGIRTLSDWREAKDWYFKNAQFMDGGTRRTFHAHLMIKAAETGCVIPLPERYAMDKLAGYDSVTEDVQQYALEHTHKLADGSVYTSPQFEKLDPEEVRECLPDLMKTASFGMHTIAPKRFGQAAENLSYSDAEILSLLMEKAGEAPVLSTRGAPVEINDEILAAL